jgi:hypothetical protein
MTALPLPELLTNLRRAVGDAHVLTEGDLSAFEQDWRKRTRGKALAVVRPGSTSEVAAVVKACAQAGVSIVPQGGNTGLVVGSIPDHSGTQVLFELAAYECGAPHRCRQFGHHGGSRLCVAKPATSR